MSDTTLTIGDETHTLADPDTVASNQTAIANLQAGSGTDLGTFTGSTITDNQTVKAAMQELETAVEGKLAVSGTPSTNDVLFYNGTQWTSGFAELLQSISRIGAGYGPPEGFINENPNNNHIRSSAPPLGDSAIYIPTDFQGNCTINGFTGQIFDNISNTVALNPNPTAPPSTSVPYVVEIAIDFPKVVTSYAIHPATASHHPYATAWDFQVYNPSTQQWVTLSEKTGQTMTPTATRPSDQTTEFVKASVSTSIISRLYRFSITGSSGSYIQFGEIGMTFKQPTSVTEVNVTGTPTTGDFIQYDGSQYVPASVVTFMSGLAPTSTTEPDGTLKYNTTTEKLYLKNGNNWVPFSKDP